MFLLGKMSTICDRGHFGNCFWLSDPAACFSFRKEEMRMKKILLVAGALASVSAAVFCVLRRRKKHYGSPC